MTTRDLLELASLDALGLLDEQERKDFERAFAAASAEVKAQLRREQARFADIDRWLPKVEPPPHLRDVVLGGIKDAIEAAQQPAVVGRIGPGVAGLWQTAPMWRAAAIGFATASVVLAGFFFSVSEQNKRIAELNATNKGADINIRVQGKLDDVLASRNHECLVFERAEGVSNALATTSMAIHYDNETGDGVLVVSGALPVGDEEYSLVILDENNRPTELLKQFDGDLESVITEVSLRKRDKVEPLKSLGRLALIGPASKGGPDQILMVARLT